MSYKACSDCGSKVYNGVCSYCDEETMIFNNQYEELIEAGGPSEEFGRALKEQSKKRLIREATP